MHWQTIVVCQCLRMDRFLFEVAWELSDDAFRQHVRHLKDLVVNLIIGSDIASPVCIQAGGGFFQGQVQMHTHHGLHLLKSPRSEEHTSELQSQSNLVCRLLLEKKKKKTQ